MKSDKRDEVHTGSSNTHTFTSAPITPKLVSLKYSKGLDLLVVLRKGYKYNGMWAAKKITNCKKSHLEFKSL